MTFTDSYNKIYKHVHRSARVCSCEENIFTITQELEVYELANIKSAKKRILVNRTKAARNKAIKSAVMPYIKKVESAVANNHNPAKEVA